MKKILIIHNNYQNIGGEDLAVINEVSLLKNFYEVETLYFSNNIENYFRESLSFILNENKQSMRKLRLKIDEFKPDYAYVHNTWFKGSLGIFKVLDKKQVKTVVKLHNFRYFCTKTYSSKSHLGLNEFCGACGIERKSLGLFNKYFENSFLKSFLVLRYGNSYYNLLKNSNFNILVLTEFHKNFLKGMNFTSDRINILPNYIDFNTEKINNTEQEDYIIYAGRISKEKGIIELIESYLESNLKTTKLKIVGDGPLLTNLKKIYKNKNIEFLGLIDNKETLSLIKSARAVVTATKLYEGQPNLLCEASLLGVPSIFPISGGIREFFPSDYALSFQQFNYKDLTNKLNLISDSNSMERISVENHKYINNYLKEKKLINEFKKVFSG